MSTIKVDTIATRTGSGNITVSNNAVLSGDLTVDTSTLKVDSSNNRVGVGTASPTSDLHVSGGAGAHVAIQSSAGSHWRLGDAVGSSNGIFVVRDHTNSANRIQILANGKTQIAQGITFGSDTSDNNTMSDYEIGVYSPSYYGASTAGSQTYSTRHGSYVKIGNLVHVQGRVYVLMNTSDCSSFSFTLPFANTQNLASDAEDTSVPVTVIRSTATGGMPAGIRSFRFGGGSATISMQNADGGPTGNFGTSSPHINVNVQYRTYQ